MWLVTTGQDHTGILPIPFQMRKPRHICQSYPTRNRRVWVSNLGILILNPVLMRHAASCCVHLPFQRLLFREK